MKWILALLIFLVGCGTYIPDYPKIPNINQDDDAFIGGENAKVVIVEFSDYLCPFCKKAEETINKINQEYGDQVKIIYRDFPVHGEEAENLAIAAECAKDQGKFWEVHNKIFELQDINLVREYILTLNIDMALYDICVDQRQKLEEINKDRQDGEYYGVEGTPTFFVNGYKLVGDHPFNNFKDLIDYELLNS
ncbi:thioredoxin domain-containing protein [Candidatus Woesearchaeota archaeon]|nr:thioredoxin domain-containing protein [Candidatus Woesearchaeota archaeon]